MKLPDIDFQTRLCVHGLAVEISSSVPSLRACLDHFLYPMSVEEVPEGVTPVTGSIRPYEEAEVLKCLSAGARRVRHSDPFMELYQDGERFWVVDESWGMVEINCLRRTFRSWVLPQSPADVVRIFDAAVMWPLAQLLRPQGLHLVPGVSLTKDGWGVLLLTQTAMEPEITRLLRAGYKLIGQRWTALRDEAGKIELLHLPGAVERPRLPRIRDGQAREVTPRQTQWIDLTLEYPGTMQNFAFCDAVLLVDPRRSMVADRKELVMPQALETLRRDWPTTELQPPKRWADLVLRVSQLCRCVKVQLSYDPADLSLMLSSIRATSGRERVQVRLFGRDEMGRPLASSSSAA